MNVLYTLYLLLLEWRAEIGAPYRLTDITPPPGGQRICYKHTEKSYMGVS